MHSHPPHNLTDRAPGPSLPGSRSLAPQTFLDVLSTALTAGKADPPAPPVPNSPALLTLTPSPPLPRRPRQPRSWPHAGVCACCGPGLAMPSRPCAACGRVRVVKTPRPRPKSPSRSYLSLLQPCGFCTVNGTWLRSSGCFLLCILRDGNSSSVEDKSDACIVPNVTEGGLSGDMS